jgi:hypothetical protein
MQSRIQEPDFSFLTHRTKNKTYYTKHYLTAKQRRDLIALTSDQGSILYEHYLRLSTIENADLSDKAAEAGLGWDIQKIKRVRRQLHDAGYFDMVRVIVPNTGRVGVWYYLGPEAVKEHQSGTAAR